MPSNWTHLIRFTAQEDGQEHLGQIDLKTYPDVGIASFEKQKISAKLINGTIFDGEITERIMTVAQLLPPISLPEVPLIRCLGLNYRDHALEAKMSIPTQPILFIKPRHSICGPYPQKISIPKLCQDGTSDYEAELTIIIGKTGRDIPKEKAMEYVLGYTCGNDVSARREQFRTTQWSFSKGFDGSAPVGPCLVAANQFKNDPLELGIKGIYNGEVMQNSNTKEMIFGVEEIVSFLSQGTSLEKGCVIMTGTPAGIGATRKPRIVLRHGDDMRVWIEGIGTLINEVYYE